MKHRHAATSVPANIAEVFEEQREKYESQISELNQRMASLRKDLVTVQEELKRDALTDAYNRRGFDAAIQQSVNMRFILNMPITLLIIDIDNFKDINDQYGHAAGDEVLKLLGECLARSFIRKSDFIARYGGDEFAVILNDTSLDNTTPLIESFMSYVEKIRIPYAGDSDRVTCSIGGTELHQDDCVVNVIERADAALYEAKASGRNCYRIQRAYSESD